METNITSILQNLFVFSLFKSQSPAAVWRERNGEKHVKKNHLFVYTFFSYKKLEKQYIQHFVNSFIEVFIPHYICIL